MVVDQLSEDEVDRLFQALADATRRDIVTRVLVAEYSVSGLAEQYNMSFAAVQKHVAVLERASLVTKEKRGREQIVRGRVDGVERVRQIWADPKQLQRWWGPPTWPATFEDYEFEEGGRAAYYMTGPDGEKARGWWRIMAVEPPRRLTFVDGFADENGDPVPDRGESTATVTLEEIDGRTRMIMTTAFESLEQLNQMVEKRRRSVTTRNDGAFRVRPRPWRSWACGSAGRA